jgi:hypothetical protein
MVFVTQIPFFCNVEVSCRVNRRYHVHWLIRTSFGPAYEAGIDATEGFRNLIPFVVVATRSTCDLQASHARDSVINDYRSILDAYDAGREAIF